MSQRVKKRYLLWGLVVIVLILLAIPKINWGEDTSAKKSSQNNKPVKVDVMIMKPTEVDNKVVTTGSLQGDEEIELRSEVSGKIIKINFDEGSKVKKGQLLVKINDADLQAQLKKAESQYELAKEKEERTKKLLNKNLISQEQYDVALNDLNSRRADIDLLKAQIDKTEIIAPFDGIVGLRTVSEGALISPSIRIATLTKTNPIKIDFSVPQKYFNKIKPGTTVNLVIPSSDKIYKATVYAVEPKLDVATRSLLVRAKTNNSDGHLVPGGYAEVDVIVGNNKDAVTIPTEALVPDIKGEKVYLYQSGQAIPQMVTTGIRTDRDIQITDGVNVGDTVIVSAIIQLRPGIDVKIRKIK